MENRDDMQLNSVELLQKNKRHKRRLRLFGGAAAVVVFITVYLLILPAITMSRTPACGLEEHTHSDACYTTTEEIICGVEESAGHTHSDACYTTEAVLACTLPENEEHTHTDACYAHQQTLICGVEESSGHTHSDACKKTETELTCSLTEHVHDDSCYPKEEESAAEEPTEEEISAEEPSSAEEETEEGIVYGDTSADVESAAVWEATMAGVTLTGNWSEDVLAIADSQLGYRESTVNTITYTDETGNRVTKGYSRYGAWYGSAYGDWCAMFCSFCLNYAQIPTTAMPQHSGCPAWITVLNGRGLYRSASSGYVPTPGDLIFYDWEGDGCCDHVGLVYEITYDEFGNATYIKTIEGNCNDMVMYSGYRFGDGRILGYGALPENPDYVDPEEAALSVQLEEEAEEAEKAEEDTVISFFAGAVTYDADAPTYTSLPVTAVSGDGTKYNKDTGNYTTSLNINFGMSGTEAQSKYFQYDYPAAIIVPSGELRTHDLYDNGTLAGTYTFIKNDDNTYSVQIVFNDDYLQKVGDNVSGFVQFDATLDSQYIKEDGRIEVKGDGFDLVIPGDKIEYPDNETNHYNISVNKSGSYSVDGNTLNYTVTVYSSKGTSAITYKDVINTAGLTLGNPTVSVAKNTYEDYGSWKYHTSGPVEVASSSYSYHYQNGQMDMSLPALAAGEEYSITYSYDISAFPEGTSFTPSNTATASCTDEIAHKVITDSGSSYVNITREYQFNKNGTYDAANNRIKWTMRVNAYQMDIAGATITDAMLQDAVDGITVKNSKTNVTADSSEFTLVTDSNGKVTAIRFNALSGKTTNTNQYYIEYYTPAPAGSWEDVTVTNTANFDGDGNPGTTGDQVVGTGNVTIGGGSVTKTCDNAVVSSDGRTAAIQWTVRLNIPAGGLPAGTVLTDNPNAIAWNGEQYLTRDQVQQWAGQMRWDTGEQVNLYQNSAFTVTFLASDGKTYTFDQINNFDTAAGITQDLTYTVLNITLKDRLQVPNGASSLSYSYHTTAAVDGLTSGNYYTNRVTVGDKTAEATWYYTPGGVTKTDGNGRTGTVSVTSDGTLTWKVQLKTGSGSSYGYLQMTDSLPAGITLESITAVDDIGWNNTTLNLESDGTIYGSNTNLLYTGTYNTETGAVTVKAARTNSGDVIPQDKTITYTLVCKVDEDKLSTLTQNANGSYTFANSVTATSDKGGSFGSSTMTQEWTEEGSSTVTKEVSKLGSWDNDNRIIHYQISVNPNGDDWVENTDTLTFHDALSYGNRAWWNTSNHISLLPYSVKLYHAATNADGTVQTDAKGELIPGTEITDWAWTYDETSDNFEWGKTTNTITGTIPDSTPLVLQYSYQVSVAGEQSSDHNLSDLQVSNRISFEGTSHSDDDIRNSDKWETNSSSAGVTTDSHYTFYKVDATDYGELLSGAVFSLESSTDGVNWSTEEKQYITVNGAFKVLWADGVYQYNKLYRIHEITAPDGYVLPDDVDDYYFYFSSTTDTTNTLPATIPAEAVDLSKRSHTAYVPNEKKEEEKTSISVQKVWSDGNEKHSADSVTVQLYQNGTAYGDAVTLSGSTNPAWYYEWPELEKTDADGNAYSYTVQETSGKEGYTVSYTNNDGINEGGITVTNTPRTYVTVNKQWFRDVDGTVTEITDRTGYIEFELYRVKTPTGSTEPDTPTHTHTWDAGVVTTEPGEYTEGVRTYTCTGCGTTRTEPIGALGHTHNWNSTVTTAATCISTGVRTYTCSGCGDSYTEVIAVDSNNHTGGTYISGAVEATETTDGYTGDTKCSGCHATLTYGAVIPATGGGTEGETVTISLRAWGSTNYTAEVEKGSTVQFTGTYVNSGWHADFTATVNGTTLAVTESGPDSNGNNVYQFTVTASDNMNVEISCNAVNGMTWSHEKVTSVQSVRSMMFAPRMLAAAPVRTPSETPSIPAGAEDLGTYQIYSNQNWTNTWYFDAEPGYTYTYYVVEKDADNYTVAYEGEGTDNLTIRNTITELSYSLPETGGSGTKRFTIAGLAIMAAALVTGLSTRRKRERRTEF